MVPSIVFRKYDFPLEVGELFDMASCSWWRYALAAAVILAITLGTLDYFTVKAYVQVSDALEIGINRWVRVMTSCALNEEGEPILQHNDLKKMKADAAVEEITFQTGTDPDPVKAKELKVFPPQAAGNKGAEFIEKVEENITKVITRPRRKRRINSLIPTRDLTKTPRRNWDKTSPLKNNDR